LREWAPNARRICLLGDCSGWQEQPDLCFIPADHGVWELRLPAERLRHGDQFRLRVCWEGGAGERLPAWARRVVQDPHTHAFNAQVWAPEPYRWRCPQFRRASEPPLIYEAHVGMAQEYGGVGTYREFTQKILPRIIDAGYNVLQLMAVQEHPYYGSFGYHVTNYFAASSRFGTPEELKELVDTAHAAGLAVIMDLIHSHAARNEVEGLSRFDGTLYQYFHEGARGMHELWDSRCFDYSKPEVLHFLLSNCRFWLDEYNFDGYRFDGITSMLYLHHGLGRAFTSYDDYFGDQVDEQAVTYLTLANKLIHTLRPDAMTIAEDVSGMPGLAAPAAAGGFGFDYRLAMGVPDHWIKLIKHVKDEDWHVGNLWHELTNRRADEKTICYAESHDQALVGDQTLIFRLIERDMYDHMTQDGRNLRVDRGLALHKMIRLATLATAGNGYLNFMGNEFGHPEWIDFPRAGNNWSYHYARRQWHLRDDPSMVYHFLADFDKAMIELARLTQWLKAPALALKLEHCQDQVLAFERARLLFLFNFSPDRSYQDYAVPATSGAYRLLLDTDAALYGGHARLASDQTYHNEAQQTLRVYLPCRTALVLHRYQDDPAARKGRTASKSSAPASSIKRRSRPRATPAQRGNPRSRAARNSRSSG
ncbi:MAG: alpha amylase C-terminal domain-containing protein, partial [Lentisphaerae bacterium]|nr:alpha amylase C-terminal domain-containing protein [Lentisphaerota bacterium]